MGFRQEIIRIGHFKNTLRYFVSALILLTLTSIFLSSCSEGESNSSLVSRIPPRLPLKIKSIHGTSGAIRYPIEASTTQLEITPDANSGNIEIVLENCRAAESVIVEARSTSESFIFASTACSVAKTSGIKIEPTNSLINKTWKFQIYQDPAKSDIVSSPDIYFSHLTRITDIFMIAEVPTVNTYNSADCKPYDQPQLYATVYIQKTKVFTENQLPELTIHGQFNSTTIPELFSSASAQNGAGSRSDKIRVDVSTANEFNSDGTMDLEVRINGTSYFSGSTIKIHPATKTFIASGDQYRRIYNHSFFTHSSNFITGGLLAGESLSSGLCEETGAFLRNAGSNPADFEIILTLSDKAGFGADHNLRVEYR